jgi:hypothetical protein
MSAEAFWSLLTNRSKASVRNLTGCTSDDMSVNKQIQSLCKEMKMRIQGTWILIQTMKILVDATWWELKMQMAEVKA